MIGRRGFLFGACGALAFRPGSSRADANAATALRVRFVPPPTIGRARVFLAAPAAALGRDADSAPLGRGNAERIETLADRSGVVAAWSAGMTDAWIEVEQCVVGPARPLERLAPTSAAARDALASRNVGWLETPAGRVALRVSDLSLIPGRL
jgi:hypothetical protein